MPRFLFEDIRVQQRIAAHTSRDGGYALLRAVAACSLVFASATASIGCGCSWGNITNIEVQPEADVEVSSESSCARLVLMVCNHGGEPLVIGEGEGSLVIAPDECNTVSDPFLGELDEDDSTCQADGNIPFTIGAEAYEITFSVEMINRGLFCC